MEYLRHITYKRTDGVSLDNLTSAATRLGYKAVPTKLSLKELREVPYPCILHWEKSHYVVLYRSNSKNFFVSDPAVGKIKYSNEKFLEKLRNKEAVVLLLKPTEEFFFNEIEENGSELSIFKPFILKYKKFFSHLFLGLVVGSIIQVAFPFLTQLIIDVGIGGNNPKFVVLILTAQLVLFINKTAIEHLRSWILIHVSTRINIVILSSFLGKLMGLPIGYFESKATGDLLQRLNDHNRVENFITTSTFTALFSFINFFIFSGVLYYYSSTVFFVFVIGSIIYFSVALFFFNKRKEVDQERFSSFSKHQSYLIELIVGMQEIKLTNSEELKRLKWEELQASLVDVKFKSLSINLNQSSLSSLIIEVKNVVIIFFVASAVIRGELSIGALFAIQYIISQLDEPLNRALGLFKSYQDAKLSLERLNEVHRGHELDKNKSTIGSPIDFNKAIEIRNLSFSYVNSNEDLVLKDMSLHIPPNKVTAIVGVSGSGKTTLFKLLLKFYENYSGGISIGDTFLSNISPKTWRDNSGVVMQDGFIFTDTIANNIALSESGVDNELLANAIKIANLESFVDRLPNGVHTKIGPQGNLFSGGEKQRILIARAVYKKPRMIFLDEATNHLDSENEKEIMQRLESFFINRTVLIIAHRLSTVRNADQIIVLNNGKVEEVGSHQELIQNKKGYYRLIKNQLDLNN